MKIETIVLNKERNVTLTCYLQDGKLNRPAMIVIPGGAYAWCSDREADPVAQAYLQAGYHAFVLRYSVGKHAIWPNPLEDYEQAVTLIRNHCHDWHIYVDKIAVIGFSAGGHLAAAIATMSNNRPNAALIGYGIVSKDVVICNDTAPDATSYVDEKTCPCFIFATRTDNVVPIRNSIGIMQALEKHQIAFESHIYSHGPHGFSTNVSSIQDRDTNISNRASHWVNDSIEWLKDIFGDFKNGTMTTPTCPRYSSDDYEEYLTLDCTLGLLMSNETSKKLIEPYFQNNKHLEEASRLTLRGALAFSEVSEQEIKELESKLNKIKNEM